MLLQDSIALVELYNGTNGNNWNINYNWLQEDSPVHLWFGVEIENYRVVQINLSYNNLAGDIPPEVGNLDSLSKLNIGSNFINSIPSSIGSLVTLDTLLLDNCPIALLPTEIGNLVDLKLLDISHTEITIIPDEIGELLCLEYLIAWDGVLESIPETIGNLTSLKEIYMPLNNISNLPSSIGNCINLSKLTLNANEIPNVPVEIGNLVNLEYLILGANNISSLPDEIYSLTNLEYLNFAANDLDTISPFIGNLTNLKNFQFFSNHFTFIPGEIGYCNSLDYINGYGNDIDSLPLTLLNLPYLETLYLAHNSLTFDDIEPLVSINGFEYWDQDSIGVNIDTLVFVDSTYYMEVITGGEFNNYRWEKNSVFIEGATNYYLELSNISLADSGIYNCEITNDIAPGLTLQSRLINLHVKVYTEVEEFTNLNPISFNVFPNPAKDKIILNIDNDFIRNKLDVFLFNQHGEMIREFIIERKNPIEINLLDLNKGIYFLQLKNIENGVCSEIGKVIKL